jgi:hypothetical protein
MAKHAKLIRAIRANAYDVRFTHACKIAEWLGFNAKAKSGTSHHAYSKVGEPTLLNFQNHKGKIPFYQAKQLIAMLDQYEGAAIKRDELEKHARREKR